MALVSLVLLVPPSPRSLSWINSWSKECLSMRVTMTMFTNWILDSCVATIEKWSDRSATRSISETALRNAIDCIAKDGNRSQVGDILLIVRWLESGAVFRFELGQRSLDSKGWRHLSVGYQQFPLLWLQCHLLANTAIHWLINTAIYWLVTQIWHIDGSHRLKKIT